MAKFFKDKTICDFNKESATMTSKDKKTSKTKGKKDNKATDRA